MSNGHYQVYREEEQHAMDLATQDQDEFLGPSGSLHFFTSKRGQKIACYAWPAVQPRGVVHVLHGASNIDRGAPVLNLGQQCSRRSRHCCVQEEHTAQSVVRPAFGGELGAGGGGGTLSGSVRAHTSIEWTAFLVLFPLVARPVRLCTMTLCTLQATVDGLALTGSSCAPPAASRHTRAPGCRR